MHEELFECEEFGPSALAAATIFFICPYGTPIQKVRFAIRRLLRAGYHVVASRKAPKRTFPLFSAPIATRTWDLLLRRHSRSVA
jgi:hypothetical protein